jgi:hypothetical protein
MQVASSDTPATSGRAATSAAGSGFDAEVRTRRSNPPAESAVNRSTWVPNRFDRVTMNTRMKTTMAYMARMAPVRNRRASG